MQSLQIVRFDRNNVSADFCFQIHGLSKGYEFAAIQDCDAVAQLGFVHQMRRERNRHAAALKIFQMCPYFSSHNRIQSRRGLIQNQKFRLMQKSFGQFHTPLHAAGQGLHKIVGPVCQFHTFQNDLDALRKKGGALESIQMPLMLEIFSDGELPIQTGHLKNDADLATDRFNIFPQIKTKNISVAAGRHEVGGENMKKGAFPAAIRTEEPKNLPFLDSKGNAS